MKLLLLLIFHTNIAVKMYIRHQIRKRKRHCNQWRIVDINSVSVAYIQLYTGFNKPIFLRHS